MVLIRVIGGIHHYQYVVVELKGNSFNDELNSLYLPLYLIQLPTIWSYLLWRIVLYYSRIKCHCLLTVDIGIYPIVHINTSCLTQEVSLFQNSYLKTPFDWNLGFGMHCISSISHLISLFVSDSQTQPCPISFEGPYTLLHILFPF